MAKDRYACTFHRNGTITYWNAYNQVWNRCVSTTTIPDYVIASLSIKDRARIEKIIAKKKAKNY